MKKIISIFLLLPLISFSVELHPEDDCETLKGNIRSDIVSPLRDELYAASLQLGYATNSYINVNNAIADFRQRSRMSAYSDEVKAAYHYCAYDSSLQPAMSYLNWMVLSAEDQYRDLGIILSDASNIVNSIDCTQCPVGTDATNCCDFTSIISAISNVQSVVQSNGREISQILQVVNRWLPQIEQYIEIINNNIQYGFGGVTNTLHAVNDSVTNLIYDFNNSVDGGFGVVTNMMNRLISLQMGSNLGLTIGLGNVTNLLSSISSSMDYATNILNLLVIPDYSYDWMNVYPQVGTSLSYPSYIGGGFTRFYSGLPYFNNEEWNYSAILYGAVPTIMLGMYELIGSSYAQNSWTQYQHDYMYPPITNSLVQIHTDTTNFFSFFRGEIGVQGVLADWTPQQGAYYDFLTNHYLSIMRGDTLSANMSTKTNWFSRIETLLAALVFPDSPSTNVVDSSAYTEQQQAINSAISSVNSSAAQSFRDFETSANSVVSLYQMFAQNFDNVALPGRIVLFTLTNEDNSSEVVEFGFSDNPALTAFVEGCRAVSTFCWASVGIFLLFKFMVWALRGIYLTILFVYKVISAVLH